ncbi:MAG: alkaline phosphatase family protein [Planctomycetes bacterium]|nr:alkaline phosphatase family protein [Planctomycetota bacterium]
MSARAAALSCLLLTAVAAAQRDAAPAPPRLVVLCSVDQLAAWVFANAEPHLAADGGFRRLLRDGARFLDCRYEHACTETGPGHATIGTGVPARVHGIVRNQWWTLEPGKDGRPGKLTYCVETPMPGLAELPEGKDRGAARLLVPTFAASLEAHVAGSKVASVSWKDRSAILMAGADAGIALWFENSTGRLVTNTAWVEATPAWLTQFNADKSIDGYFGWTWDRCAGPDAYAGLVDDRPYEAVHGNGRKQRTLPQPVDGGLQAPGSAFYTQAYASPVGNTMVRLAAEAAVRGMDLGGDAVPDLLCVSFSSTDTIGHAYGPDSVEARDALLRLDQELARLWTFFDERVGKGRWAVFLTADHGVAPTPEWAKANGVDAGRGTIFTFVKAAMEAALREQFGAPPEGRKYVAHVGEGSCYFDEELLSARGGDVDATRLQLARVAAAAAKKVRGIGDAFATADLLTPTLVRDELRECLAQALCPGRAGDVQVVVKPYWLDGMTTGAHGSPHPYDRQVVGLAMGAGIPAGARFAQRITPGFGVTLFAAMLEVPRPVNSAETLPVGLLGTR